MAASLEAAASQVVVALVQHSLKHALQPYARSQSIVSSFMKYFSVICFFFKQRKFYWKQNRPKCTWNVLWVQYNQDPKLKWSNKSEIAKQ